MTKHDMILNEIRSLRIDYDIKSKELNSAQQSISILTQQIKVLTEKIESQAVYTAIMTNTLMEIE